MLPASPAVATSTPSQATPSATLNCNAPIGAVSTPPRSLTSISGTVALQTRSSTHRAIQAAAQPDATSPYERYSAKTPLYVRTGGAKAEIIVPRKWLGRLALDWGNSAPRTVATESLTVGPCAGSARWIVFPGSYYLAKPACIELVIRVTGHDHRVRMGVGTPCPGQRPPIQPSDS